MAKASVYTVARAASGAHPLDADWDQEPWLGGPPLEVDNVMGDPPEHRPRTRARLLYDNDALYVCFRVEDRWVVGAQPSAATVCRDSCVELFFTPGENLADGYFNVECGCQGLVLFRHQTGRGQDQVTLPPDVVAELCVRTTLPARVWPEIADPVTWSVRYRIPIGEIVRFAPVTRPAPGVRWRANLYKCADASSHPHWLTWSRVDRPQPDFHLPEYFGTLVFG